MAEEKKVIEKPTADEVGFRELLEFFVTKGDK